MDLQHVLAIPVPLTGHIVPMLNLCIKLVSRGCKRITIIINEDKLETLTNLQQQVEEYSEFPLTGIVSTRLIPVVLPPFFTDGDDQILRLSQELEGTKHHALAAALELSKESSGGPISCVLADVLLAWAQDVANELRVPRFALSILALAELNIGIHMPELISSGSFDPFKDESWKSSELIHVPGLPPLQASEIPQVSRFPKSNKAYWSYLLRNYGRACEAKGILVNSCFHLEKKGYEALVRNHKLPLHFIGPLITPAPKTPSELPCIDWLSRKPPRSVIYVSFGSFLQFRSSQLENIMFGIRDSGYNFLLAFRTDVLEDEASPALDEFLRSYSELFEVVAGGADSQGFIVAWAPQVEVLNHPSVGGLFTHYGSSSMSESISAGVPMMGKPILGDQFVTRKLARDEWGIGVHLEEDEHGIIHRNAVKDAAMKLMLDENIQANAARLKECVNKSVTEGGDSYAALTQLINV